MQANTKLNHATPSIPRMLGWLMASVTILSLPVQAQEARCRYVNLSEINFQVTQNQPLVEAKVNQNSGQFLLSTGATQSAIFSDFAEKTGLALKHTTKTKAGIGGYTRNYTTLIESMSIGKIKGERLKFPVLKQDLVPTNIAGILGSDFLLRHDIEIDWSKSVLRFFHPENCAPDAPLAYWDQDAIVVPLEIDAEQSPIIEVMLNGQKLRARISSGSTATMVDLAHLKKSGIAFQQGEKLPDVSGIGENQMQAWRAQFDLLQIGTYQLAKPSFKVADFWGNLAKQDNTQKNADSMRKNYQMVLGADFLRTHRVLFATSQKKLYFSAAPTTEQSEKP